MPTDREQLLNELHQLTEQLHQVLYSLKLDMEQNDPEQVETVNQLLNERGAVIAKLNQLISSPPVWSTREQQLISNIKEWETRNQQQLKGLYQAFSSQIQKLQQGKKLTQHYHGSYEPVYIDGVYIDKKK